MTFTQERITNLLEFNSEGSDCQANAEQWEVHKLARIALASLEAEASGRNPVLAYADSYRDMANQGVESIPVWSVITDLERNIAPLFTAPPAPISVPAAMEMDDDFDSSFEHGKAVGWNACRAAMLQGANGTLTNEGTITATQFKPVADLYGLTSPTGGETSFTFDAVEARDFIDGGWSCQEYVELGRFQEAVSGNSPVIPGCSCLTCRPLTFSDSRFVVCPECGNKRCPHANDHRNACTGSNEPGQEGSAYPAAPQQEVESQIRKGKTVAMEEWELGGEVN
ncbi:hypothetical protein [Enterobacter asburiae]|uniref:hypothetical protein n=1 Tax=Enterobacter asburiae TaxID=61645 RepID=UPI003BE84706